MVGIASMATYSPRRRLSRQEIALANQWRGLRSSELWTGERPVCGWDEDEVTMAVAAAQQCSPYPCALTPASVHYGSGKVTHSGRQSGSLIADVLAIEGAQVYDIISNRAGTSVLLSAVQAVEANGAPALAVCSERRRPPPGSRLELVAGDGAAAAMLTPESGIAQFLGSKSLNVDFVSQFRGEDLQAGYVWEDRWIIEEGYLKLIPPVVGSLLRNCGLDAGAIDHMVWHCPFPRARKQLAKRLGLREKCQFVSELNELPDIGAGLTIHLLAIALQTALPGEKILVLNFGQGCDALLFEATSQSFASGRPGHVSKTLTSLPLSYQQYLVLTGLIETDRGLKSEVDNFASLSLRHRNADFLLRFMGGRCRRCETAQIPRSLVCVNPSCNGIQTQDALSFSNCRGSLITWSADLLATTDTPPALTGLVDFEGGGRLLMDLVDFRDEELSMGADVLPSFRVRAVDRHRGFTSYFWKGAPLACQSE